MKNIFLFLMTLLPAIGFSQQVLWSTTDISLSNVSNVELISSTAVAQKVVSYYEFYDYYYDLTGFTKAGLEELLNKNTNTAKLFDWSSDLIFEHPTAIAFKANEGYGSIVFVVLFQKENIDIILFSNNYDNEGAIRSYSYETSKFKKWFTSLWHFVEKDKQTNLNAASSEYEMSNGLFDRKYVVRPKLTNDENISGIVVFEVSVDRKGNVVSVRPGVKGTTFSSPKLYSMGVKAFMEAKFTPSEDAPERQTGTISVNFIEK